MSTRRARIKAVAVLPPRRKNADSAEGNKNKPSTPKEVENALKSPKTPKSLDLNNAEGTSVQNQNTGAPASSASSPAPYIVPASPARKTPIISSPKKTPLIKSNLPARSASPRTEVTRPLTPKPVESVPSPLPKTPVFALPRVKTSPLCRTILSPKPQNDVDDSEKLAPADLMLDSDTPTSVVELIDPQTLPKDEFLKSPPIPLQKKNDAPPKDYNPPSVPESVTDDSIIDGIVPLQSANRLSKPIEELKNQLISEYNEVLFDPIVPLPSPSKVRPKLRPIPRLGPHRRNSIQGSASESEDESRRAMLIAGPPTPVPPRVRHDSHTLPNLPSVPSVSSVPSREGNRTRNDSVCSSVSQITSHPPPATSPTKDKHFNKIRRQEMGKRIWRRRRDTVKRDALTMYDLIFYNPTTNPIVPDQDEIKAKEADAKDEAERAAHAEAEDEAEDEPEEAAPVPQIKLGPNGEIILDEKSLVINQSSTRRVSGGVVREGAWGGGAGRYTRAPRTADWAPAETVRFYRALAALGTDFSLMAQLFPDRSRKDLKLKFKKEERLNGAQVDKALRSATTWDVIQLQDDFRREREEQVKQAEKERQMLLLKKKEEKERLMGSRELKIRQSRGSKALENFAEPTAGNDSALYSTADDFIQRARETKAKRTKRKATAPTSTETTNQGPFATITRLSEKCSQQQHSIPTNDFATITRVDQSANDTLTNVPGVPPNIESGSLVVLRVNDPRSTTKTMLQTYIARGAGKLTPVALPSTFLNSVVGYMKKTPQTAGSTPPLRSPIPVSVNDRSGTPSVIQLNPSPVKRQRHSSYSITPL